MKYMYMHKNVCACVRVFDRVTDFVSMPVQRCVCSRMYLREFSCKCVMNVHTCNCMCVFAFRFGVFKEAELPPCNIGKRHSDREQLVQVESYMSADVRVVS